MTPPALDTTVRAADWLAQFDATEQLAARGLLQSLTLVSHDEFRRSLLSCLERVRSRATGPMALYSVREIEADRDYFINKREKPRILQSTNTVGSEAIVAQAIAMEAYAQALRVQSSGLPAVLTLNHLAVQTGIPYVLLRQLVSRSRRRAYRFFKMKKRAGGHRLICIPEHALSTVQKWISTNILSKIPAHAASGAYAPGCSPIAVARAHCGCRWLIKLDVRQFFESISEQQVYYVFRSAGYEPLIAFEMARICTRVHVEQNARYGRRKWRASAKHTARAIVDYSCDGLGHLPQGSPTSPMLSNLVMRGFDALVGDYAAQRNLRYTRYADDLIFSTASPTFTRSLALDLIRWVNTALRNYGLRPHASKAVVAPPGARKVVLGLVVDRESPRLPREQKRKLQHDVYALEKFGPEAHASSRGWMSPLAMKLHLDGLLTYAATVEPESPVRSRND